VHNFKGPGVAMGMHNTRESIEGFARASFNYGKLRGYPVYLSTKNTILKAYDGMFKDVFQEIFDNEFKADYTKAKLTYEHRLIDDMVACALKWNGGYLWACKNYDGDVESDIVAQGFWQSWPNDQRFAEPGRQDRRERGGARHGHAAFPRTPEGRETSTNPIASIFAWTRGLSYRGRFDATPDVTNSRKHWKKSVSRRWRAAA